MQDFKNSIACPPLHNIGEKDMESENDEESSEYDSNDSLDDSSFQREELEDIEISKMRKNNQQIEEFWGYSNLNSDEILRSIDSYPELSYK